MTLDPDMLDPRPSDNVNKTQKKMNERVRPRSLFIRKSPSVARDVMICLNVSRLFLEMAVIHAMFSSLRFLRNPSVSR